MRARELPAAFDDLIAEIKDSPAEKQLLEETKALAVRRIEISSEMIRLQTAGDTAGGLALMTRAEGRTTTEKIGVNLDKAMAEVRTRLADRYAASRATRRFLLAIDLAGAVAHSHPRHRPDPDLAAIEPRAAGFAERDAGRQRIAGGRGRRAHRTSGRRP